MGLPVTGAAVVVAVVVEVVEVVVTILLDFTK